MQDTGRNSNKDSNMDNDMNNNANNNVNEQPPSDDKRLREMYDKLVGYASFPLKATAPIAKHKHTTYHSSTPLPTNSKTNCHFK